MTAKRFEFRFCSDELYYFYIIDNETGKEYKYLIDDDLLKLLNNLHEENQRLQKVIEENEELIQSTYNELSKLRTIKKNLTVIKARWNWIMESLDYD